MWDEWRTALVTSDEGPLPTSVADKTISLCHNHDTVCAPGKYSCWGPHTDYEYMELWLMGRWLATNSILNVVYPG
jgi:hypothetical protein